MMYPLGSTSAARTTAAASSTTIAAADSISYHDYYRIQRKNKELVTESSRIVGRGCEQLIRIEWTKGIFYDSSSQSHIYLHDITIRMRHALHIYIFYYKFERQGKDKSTS